VKGTRRSAPADILVSIRGTNEIATLTFSGDPLPIARECDGASRRAKKECEKGVDITTVHCSGSGAIRTPANRGK